MRAPTLNREPQSETARILDIMVAGQSEEVETDCSDWEGRWATLGPRMARLDPGAYQLAAFPKGQMMHHATNIVKDQSWCD